MTDLKKNHRASDIRVDLFLIANNIPEGSKVLDVGSGDGMLLEYLRREKNVFGRGIELSPDGVNQSIAKGLSVIQGNAEEEISHFPDDSFDYVILSIFAQFVILLICVMSLILKLRKEWRLIARVIKWARILFSFQIFWELRVFTS